MIFALSFSSVIILVDVLNSFWEHGYVLFLLNSSILTQKRVNLREEYND